MTVRHKKEDGQESMTLVKWGMTTNVFRSAILILVLSMHPLGRQVLGTFGFKFPDEQKLTLAADQAKDIRSDISTLQKDVAELKETVPRMAANNAIINSKLDRLETTITGFQVDFAKWKPQPKDP